MKKLLLLSAFLIFACSDNNSDIEQTFLEKYNNILFDNTDDVDGNPDKLWFSDGIIRYYWEGSCTYIIKTEGSTYLSENEWLWEYGSGSFNSSIVENTADKLVLQLEVGYDSSDICSSSWYNTWTFTISGNSLTFESNELTFCDPNEFVNRIENFSKTTEDIPDC